MPVAGPSQIRVEGMAALRKALHAVDVELPKELKAELKDLSEQVARGARVRMAADGAVKSGKAAASIRAFSTATRAGVRGGRGTTTPYFGWLDFGGVIRHHGPRHEHSRGHLIRRDFKPQGRYLYPEADRQSKLLAPRVEDLLDRLFVKAGFTE